MQNSSLSSRVTLWPALTRESRPWTRWWWLGSAVDETEITRHLELLKQAGIGGVEISPIYAAADAEAQSVPYLSPRWLELLRHTLREAERLNLGVDLLLGTGWPLGGPWVADHDAAARVVCESFQLSSGERLAGPLICKSVPAARLCALLGFSADRQACDLSQHLNAQQRLDWTPPGGEWRVFALFQVGTGQQVKRAAPGGEGNVVDHFAQAGMARYLEHFDRSLAALPDQDQPRCFFNDSYEVYGANWTEELLQEFQQRRGYDLRHYLPALFGQDDHDIVRRVRSDYRQTIADTLLENFVKPWTAWAHGRGSLTRNQAHGSPGNLLDLYAAADIPETETFGSDWLTLAGLDPLPATLPHHGGRAEILACKLASSAAHVTGKPLCSCESFTWLGEHGQVPLAHMKAQLDLMFVMGVNHVFFHGTPTSPADAEWPGWLFYASTHVAPSNPCWRHLPALSEYISRCQSFLQSGQPDNDLLLYFPMFDLWATEHGVEDLLHFLGPHNTTQWLDQALPDFTETGRRLWDRGYSFDCISDQLLTQALEVVDGQLQSRGVTYKALVVAGCTLMPWQTFERLLALAEAGGNILIVGDLPQDVPGLSDLTEQRRRLRTRLAALRRLHAHSPGISEAPLGKGRLLVGADVEALVQAAGIRRERVVDTGIELIRRRDDHGYLYFLVNLSRQRLDRWVSLPIQAESVVIFDPASGDSGVASSRALGAGETQLYLQLEPGQSLLLRTFSQAVEGEPWSYLAQAAAPLPLQGQWQVDFIDGGPTLPTSTTIEQLTSWTEWPGDQEAHRAFAGTARYSITFESPQATADAWALDLGSVCHSAHVRLNGHDLGTLYAPPFRIVLACELDQHPNVLEIEVTNLMANRLAHMDRQGVPWRKFFFVNMRYEDFDASAWEPLPSGLLGPVQLVPLRRLANL